ncbi:PLD nuclease N-terminal domain-containing protein [Listeria costaricensis]|uniref:PLD nuclease N-terminal domain-containing protein n=1 Tax=Listeria costaricensis TaxID=2026604 RepID=UPI000C077840|nr:PLD nuclease N-terminal domain-containing protein [Listeria costaricensis]
MEVLGVNILVVLPLLILYFILLITALVDLVRHWSDRRQPILWLVVILFINILGPILYFILGRKEY